MPALAWPTPSTPAATARTATRAARASGRRMGRTSWARRRITGLLGVCVGLAHRPATLRERYTAFSIRSDGLVRVDRPAPTAAPLAGAVAAVGPRRLTVACSG